MPSSLSKIYNIATLILSGAFISEKMDRYSSAPSDNLLRHNNHFIIPPDENEMHFDNTNHINNRPRNNRWTVHDTHDMHMNDDDGQIWYYGFVPIEFETDDERRNRENITRNQNNSLRNAMNGDNSAEIDHNINEDHENFIRQAAAQFQRNGNSNDTLTENDYAEIATISRNFIPPHHIGGVDSFSALGHLASAAERLQQVDDNHDDLDLMIESSSDWESQNHDINQGQDSNGDLINNAVDR